MFGDIFLVDMFVVFLPISTHRLLIELLLGRLNSIEIELFVKLDYNLRFLPCVVCQPVNASNFQQGQSYCFEV